MSFNHAILVPTKRNQLIYRHDHLLQDMLTLVYLNSNV